MLPSTIVDVRAGAVIRDDGAWGRHIPIVDRGLVTIIRKVDRTRSACVGLAAAGDLTDGISAMCGASSDPVVELRAFSPVRMLLVPDTTFRAALRRHPELRAALLSQVHAALSESRLIAACNARHSLLERAAHWLLWLRAQLGSDTLPATHENIAAILGVRRAGVTVAFQALQRQGLLQQHRGGLTIADPDGLRQHACGCAETVAAARLVKPRLPTDPSAWLDDPPRDGPRAAIAAALAQRGVAPQDVDLRHARRDVALQLCRSIVAETERLLAP